MARVPCVIVVKNNVVEENVLCRDGKHAEKVFLDKLAERLSNWDEYDQDDIDAVLDNGYEEFGNGSVCLSWAMSGDEDEEYLGMDKGEETKFVARVTVVDPDSHGEVEVEIRKIVEGGSMVGLDGSFLEQDVGCVYSPYDFGVRLRVPDDEEKSLSRAEQLLKDAIDGLVEFYPELTRPDLLAEIKEEVKVRDTGNDQSDYENAKDQVEKLAIEWQEKLRNEEVEDEEFLKGEMADECCEVCGHSEAEVGPLSSNEEHERICDDCLGK